MRKAWLGMMFLAMGQVFFFPGLTRADVEISVSLPPLIEFSAPPAMVVLPDTNVYVVPDASADIFFYQGWWWRPWHGRWYRSQDYRSGWGYYRSAPAFYRSVPSGWRDDYRAHRWQGHAWNYQRIPHQQVQSNWHNWEQNRHWEKQNGWGVQGGHSREPYREGQPARAYNQPNGSVHQVPHEMQSPRGGQQGQVAHPAGVQPGRGGQQPGGKPKPNGEDRGHEEHRRE